MLTDKEVLAWSAERSDPGMYNEDEMARLLDTVKRLPIGASIVEIGVYSGRTAMLYILEQIRRWQSADRDQQPFDISLIDKWVLNQSDSRPQFEKNMTELKHLGRVPWKGYWTDSKEAAQYVPYGIDLLHIDGDHIDGIWDDCRLYLPKLKLGGTVFVHDYGKPDEYPEVQRAVAYYFSNIGSGQHYVGRFRQIGVVGSQFGAVRVE